MPSGSHRTSPGSHRSGSSSHSYRSHHTSFTPIFVTSRHKSNSVSSNPEYAEALKRPLIKTLSTIFGIMIIVLFCSIIAKVSFATRVHEIKSDYNYYQHMCEWATQYPQWKGTANVTAKEQKYGKWCIKYKIVDTDTGLCAYGYSFAIYDDQEIEQFQIGDQIEVAMSSFSVSLDVDSVPMDYYQIQISRDGEYLVYSTINNCVTAVLVISIVATVAIGITNSILIKKRINELQGDYSPSQETQTTHLETIFCEYCHSKLPPNSTTCEHCGASIKQDK